MRPNGSEAVSLGARAVGAGLEIVGIFIGAYHVVHGIKTNNDEETGKGVFAAIMGGICLTIALAAASGVGAPIAVVLGIAYLCVESSGVLKPAQESVGKAINEYFHPPVLQPIKI